MWLNGVQYYEHQLARQPVLRVYSREKSLPLSAWTVKTMEMEWNFMLARGLTNAPSVTSVICMGIKNSCRLLNV